MVIDVPDIVLYLVGKGGLLLGQSFVVDSMCT